MSETIQADVAIVGAGLAGLTAAALLAGDGRRVVVLEKANHVGGRAVTSVEEGLHFNLGPHALYRNGAAHRVIRDLGVSISGRLPSASGGFALANQRAHTLPGGPISLLTTGLFGLSAKLEVGRLLATFPRIDAAKFDAVPVREWLNENIRQEPVRQLLAALFRLSTYGNAPGEMSAGAAIAQFQLALAGNVLYLDGGWQTMIDGLLGKLEAQRVQIMTGVRVDGLEKQGAGVVVRTATGDTVNAGAVILTSPPAEAAALTGSPLLRAFAESAIPLRAACLDVGLRRLPNPSAKFALGIDQPHYFSVHSAIARLAPDGRAVVHVAKYLPVGQDSDAKSDRAELDAVFDLVQPGWRSEVSFQRFLPKMTVVEALPTAAMGGTKGRPDVDASGIESVYVAGDWVGPHGMLADAAVASAERSAQSILDRVVAAPRVAA